MVPFSCFFLHNIIIAWYQRKKRVSFLEGQTQDRQVTKSRNRIQKPGSQNLEPRPRPARVGKPKTKLRIEEYEDEDVDMIENLTGWVGVKLKGFYTLFEVKIYSPKFHLRFKIVHLLRLRNILVTEMLSFFFSIIIYCLFGKAT